MIDNLLVQIHLIIVMVRWTGLAPWKFEFSFPGSLTSTLHLEQSWTVWPRGALRGGIPVSFLEPLCRSWSHFVGIYCQKFTKSSKNDF